MKALPPTLQKWVVARGGDEKQPNYFHSLVFVEPLSGSGEAGLSPGAAWENTLETPQSCRALLQFQTDHSWAGNKWQCSQTRTIAGDHVRMKLNPDLIYKCPVCKVLSLIACCTKRHHMGAKKQSLSSRSLHDQQRKSKNFDNNTNKIFLSIIASPKLMLLNE